MDKKPSENISEFLNFLTASKQLCEFCKAEMDKQDKLTQDILHYKDRVEELEPVREYLEANKKVYNELTKLLGTVRKSEKYHSSRTYRPKVMDFEPIVTEEAKG